MKDYDLTLLRVEAILDTRRQVLKARIKAYEGVRLTSVLDMSTYAIRELESLQKDINKLKEL